MNHGLFSIFVLCLSLPGHYNMTNFESRVSFPDALLPRKWEFSHFNQFAITLWLPRQPKKDWASVVPCRENSQTLPLPCCNQNYNNKYLNDELKIRVTFTIVNAIIQSRTKWLGLSEWQNYTCCLLKISPFRSWNLEDIFQVAWKARRRLKWYLKITFQPTLTNPFLNRLEVCCTNYDRITGRIEKFKGTTPWVMEEKMTVETSFSVLKARTKTSRLPTCKIETIVDIPFPNQNRYLMSQ